ncbi:MAG TPA: hypothetical protein VKX49_01965 [Bryobacteraceae bacterium]|nr:hypothetical protein [Bryobacteraceae bacterium]
MAFRTFAETRPWAKAIRDAVLTRKMPPWFADPEYGHFANDPSLSPTEIQTLAQWATAGAPAGRPSDGPRPREWPEGWNIGVPDQTFEMPDAFSIPASGAVEYQYIVVPTHFSEDRWVERVEVRPSNRATVHHAVVYVRERGSQWLKDEPVDRVFSLPASPAHVPNPKSVTTSDVLMVYTPGNSYETWKPGVAKKIPAGADLVLQVHYTATGRPTSDRTSIGVIFSKQPPRQAVLTLQMGNDQFTIPPGDPNYRVSVAGTLPNDAVLTGMLPHMHLRGKAFEYLIYAPNGAVETLLKINNYDFHWQIDYRLAKPRLLKAGTRVACVGYFDNSANNPRNPDPSAEVRFGEQSWQEMFIGFFDVLVDADTSKAAFFERKY